MLNICLCIHAALTYYSRGIENASINFACASICSHHHHHHHHNVQKIDTFLVSFLLSRRLRLLTSLFDVISDVHVGSFKFVLLIGILRQKTHIEIKSNMNISLKTTSRTRHCNRREYMLELHSKSVCNNADTLFHLFFVCTNENSTNLP
jgi:hypothetical protein